MKADELQARLSDFLVRATGSPQVTITGLRRLPGGASRETWSFDLGYEERGQPVQLALVLRRDPGKTNVQSDRRDEFLLIQAAHAAGVPVPKVYWLGDGTEGIGPFFLMERVEGETIARRLLRDPEYATARAVMTAQLGEIAADIHRVDWRGHGLDFLAQPPPGESPAKAEIDRFEDIYRGIALEPHPTFELAFRWLRPRLPAAGDQGLVHGDYRIGNVMFGPEGTRAILDWELAHVGDPMEDLAWLCVRAWRFGNDTRPVGGIGERAELFAAYEKASGRQVDPARVHFWEVLGNLKWAIMCLMQSRTHIDGFVRSVELAAIGRRTAEVELELLQLIDDA